MVHSKNFYKNRESSFCLKKARRLEDLLKSLVKNENENGKEEEELN